MANLNDNIEKLLRDGKTPAWIAKHLGTSEPRVQRVLDRLRKRGEIK